MFVFFFSFIRYLGTLFMFYAKLSYVSFKGDNKPIF
jgi:hypothetical protein